MWLDREPAAEQLRNPLLRRPTGPERCLLDTAIDVQDEHELWPTYQWMERELGRAGYDIDVVLAGMPRVGDYGWCTLLPGSVPPAPDRRVGLTVAGMATQGSRGGLVGRFLTVLQTLCRLRLELVESPVTAGEVIVTDDQLRYDVPGRSDDLAMMRTLLEHEPPTWALNRHRERTPGGGSGDEVGYVLAGGGDRTLRRFTGVRTVQDYLDIVVALLGAPIIADVPPLPATALHSALDLLDMVWRLRQVNGGTALLRLTSAQRTARLADIPSSLDELAARLAALIDILEKLDVPGPAKTPTLVRLRQVCRAKLDAVGSERTDRALDVIDQIRVLRNGLTHTGRVSASAYAAAAALALPWPPHDAANGWHRIVGHTVAAVDTIREELDLSAAAENPPAAAPPQGEHA